MRIFLSLSFILMLFLLSVAASYADSIYETATASKHGIGKIYMGREISRVMGHRAAGWLEREGRESEERTDLLVNNLEIKETDVIADIGAGTGYFTFRLSPLVPKGSVIAVEIQQEMLDLIEKKKGDKFSNVKGHLGTITDTKLEESSVDLILMVDSYHEFSHPYEMGVSMVKALKPGGRIALVEYRKEDPKVLIKLLHKMSEEQSIKEMEALGLKHVKTRDVLPQQHLMFFEKPAL
jgi:ubiquinone/menaquinone biosynthesis C-methylase UbiE